MKISLVETKTVLENNDNCLILTHRRPDGDTIGSAAALCRLLRLMGKTAFVAPNEDSTSRFDEFLDGLYPKPGFEPDFIISVDIADLSLLCPSMEEYGARIDLCLDHHPSNKLFAKVSHVREDACATGEIVWQLLELWNVEPTHELMNAFYVSVATDTGCFRYSNTTPLAHNIAAKCITMGIDFVKYNIEFFSKKTKSRFAIEKTIYDSLIFSDDGLIGAGVLSRGAINEAGATEDDLDNLSSLIINLEGLCCGILLIENKNGAGCKASVRTHKPLDASRICAAFGGGGHARAAGCNMRQGLDEARAMLTDAAAAEIAAELKHV